MTKTTATKKRRRALGIETGDIVRTSYGTGLYVVQSFFGPVYVTREIGAVVVRDHPEISLALSPLGKEQVGAYINDVRRVGDRWFTAQNDEVIVERPERAPVVATSLLDLIDPPDAVEEIPMPAPYQFDEAVDYEAGANRVWHCPTCGKDFNGELETRRNHSSWCESKGGDYEELCDCDGRVTMLPYCLHDCGTSATAERIYYMKAPADDDLRRYPSYYVVTLNHAVYEALPNRRQARAEAA